MVHVLYVCLIHMHVCAFLHPYVCACVKHLHLQFLFGAVHWSWQTVSGLIICVLCS